MVTNNKKRTYRALEIDKNQLEFSEGFENLHTESYLNILKGNGFNLEENTNFFSTIHMSDNWNNQNDNTDYGVLAGFKMKF